jgi:hypothetical protein
MTVHHPNRRPHRHARAGLAAVSVATALLLGACGDDDDDNAGSSDAAPATVADTSGAAGDQEDATGVCAPYLDLTFQFNNEPDPNAVTAALADVEANTPAELTDSVATLTAAVRQVLESGGEDFSPFETVEFLDAQIDVDGWVYENCEFDATYEVTAEEYAFEGMPSEVESGLVAVKLINEGQEAHELGVARKVEGVTETWQEILELPEEEADAKVVFIGSGFAPTNGSNGYAFLDTREGGEYVALCFISTGTVMSADGEFTEGSGPPHFVQGMIHEFTVG